MGPAAGRGGLPERLLHQALILVTGKGGVGKTVVTAALGRWLHRAGRRVLLLEIDPRESLNTLLDVAPSGGEIVDVEPGLQLQNLTPRMVADEVVREQLRIELLVRRVLRSPVYHTFVEGAPGIKELAVLGHAYRVLEGMGRSGRGRPDVVVIDAPATGHGVSLLEAPGLVSRVITKGPFAHMASELATLVGSPERCGVVVVTTAEEMPVQEAIELTATLGEKLGREADVVVVNALYPVPPSGAGDDGAEMLWRQRRRINEVELARLARHWSGPKVELPLLPQDGGAELVRRLQARL